MDLLGVGLAWLERKRTRFLARPVVYRRGTQEITVGATIGTTVFRLDTGPGLTERIESRDFLIATLDLVPLPVFQQPQRGDRVFEIDATHRHSYEVIAPGHEPVWRWSDPNRACYRIHTKLVKTETL